MNKKLLLPELHSTGHKTIIYNISGYEGNSTDINNVNIKFLFGSFDRPNNDYFCKPTTLNIVVDHSFDIYETDNVLFMDHHAVEELTNNFVYTSNADLLYIKYQQIYEQISYILSNYNYTDIHIYMHHDLDGISSGLIIRKILNDIKHNTLDDASQDKLIFAKILGDYGDLSDTAKISLAKVFDSSIDIDIFDKKLAVIRKMLSNFMKSVRGIDFYKYSNNTLLEYSINSKFNKYGYSCDTIRYTIKHICDIIQAIDVIDTKNILLFLNQICQQKFIIDVVDIYKHETDEITNTLVNADSYLINFSIIFTKYPKTKFTLLVIDSPFDCGRSIIWKYRNIKLKEIKEKFKPTAKYNNSDEFKKYKELEEVYSNIVCYNTALNKASFDGKNEDAYNIAKNVFAGGGHDSDNTGRSIGSVVIDYNMFVKEFVVSSII